MVDFSRQVKAGWNQRKIRTKIVGVVGCGGGGNVVAHMLAMIGVEIIVLCDHDSVTASNLNRQIYYDKDIDTQKVDALSDKLKLINPNLTVLTYPYKFMEAVKEGAFSTCDLIFDCVDTVQSKEEINKFCIDQNKVLIHGGTSDKIGEVSLIIRKKSACLACFPYSKEKRKAPRGCNDFAPSICTTNFITASLMIELFINHIHKKSSYNQAFYVQNKGIRYSTKARRPDCKVCK